MGIRNRPGCTCCVSGPPPPPVITACNIPDVPLTLTWYGYSDNCTVATGLPLIGPNTDVLAHTTGASSWATDIKVLPLAMRGSCASCCFYQFILTCVPNGLGGFTTTLTCRYGTATSTPTAFCPTPPPPNSGATIIPGFSTCGSIVLGGSLVSSTPYVASFANSTGVPLVGAVTTFFDHGLLTP